MVVEAISAAMKAAVRRIFAARPCPLLAAGLLAAASLVALGTGPAGAAQTRFTIPASARQLVVVSSPTYDPANYLARFQSFARASATSAWKPVFATWETEIGSGELRDVRREGDHATPTGVYGFGLATIYGAWPNPGGLHAPYHRFVCGDWWDEDPYSARVQPFRARRLYDDAALCRLVRAPVGGDGGRQGLPVPGRHRLQPRPDDRRPGRARVRDIPPRLDGRPDRGLHRPSHL